MKSIGSLALLAICMLCSASVEWARTGPSGLEPVSQAFSGRDWRVKQKDNICGLKSPDQLSKPAKVDYQELLDATPEMKKMRDDKVDRNTPEGIRLRSEAVNRVNAACEKIRVANGYCSVWKEIKRKDGKAVADITAKVKAVL